MSDLFAAAGLSEGAPRPLADRLRPDSLVDVIGQDHLLGPDGPLRRMLDARHLTSTILWGPPGVGKTTIARLLADETDLHFESISAIFSGVKDLRAVFDQAEARRATGHGTLLFVDEIHRFNKAQQDGFLPFVESGVVTLVGATTENPSFEIIGALLSRCQVMVLKPLAEAGLGELLRRAEALEHRELPVDTDARAYLISLANGDGRYLLNLVEQVFGTVRDEQCLKTEQVAHLLQRKAANYDKSGDGHYNLISALHKSVRGSDPDAALYWFARMLEGGEDPLFLARRLVRMASEDVGLADPTALMVCAEAARAYERLGSPEGELALAHAVVHLATAPKSNAVYKAFNAARVAARQTGALPPPAHILNAPTQLMKDEGYGAGYVYDHDTEEGVSGQNYFPDDMPRETFYAPRGVGREKPIVDKLKAIAELRKKRGL